MLVNLHPTLKLPALAGHWNPQVSLVLPLLAINVLVRMGERVLCPFDVFVCVCVSQRVVFKFS